MNWVYNADCHGKGSEPVSAWKAREKSSGGMEGKSGDGFAEAGGDGDELRGAGAARLQGAGIIGFGVGSAGETALVTVGRGLAGGSLEKGIERGGHWRRGSATGLLVAEGAWDFYWGAVCPLVDLSVAGMSFGGCGISNP